jgi:hypothetical protein
MELAKTKGFRGLRNASGRPKGTNNIVTQKVRDAFGLLVENNLDQMQKDLAVLDPKDRVKLLIEMAKFIVPTLRSVDLNDNTEGQYKPIVINMNEWQ